MDTFFEFLVKRKKSVKDVLIIALVLFATTAIVFLLTYIYLTPFSMFALPLQALVIFLCYKLITSRNIEFEYCVTNGDLDVDKIANRQKRTRVLTVEAKSISIMAPLGDSRIPPHDKMEVTDVTSGADNANVYCVIYGEGKGKVLYFEPTPAMVLEIQKRNPRNVFVEKQ